MIDKDNIKHIVYCFETNTIEITLKKPDVINGYNRHMVTKKASYEEYCKYIKKYLD